MDDSTPTLGVGFAIDTGGSFDHLTHLQNLMSSVEAKIVADAAKIERATAGMIDLAGATASVQTFGNASKREYYDIAREKARTEKSGESLIRQLDRESAAFGRTRAELRATKAETLALAATKQGNIDLAQRISAAEAALYDQEFAAARKARSEAEAAMQAREAAAAQAVAAAEKEAASVREAALAYQMFEAAARKGAAAAREQELAEAAASNEARAMSAAAAQLRASIDPMYMAQQRFDDELDRAERLLAANILGEREYAQAVQLARDNLYAHAKAVTGSTQVTEQMGASVRKSSFAMKQFAIQIPDIVQGLLTGQSPMQVFIQQGGQIAQVAQMAEGGIAGFAAELGGLALAFAPLIAIAAVVALGAGAWFSYSEQTARAEALTIGAGRVIGLLSDDIQKQAAAATEHAKISVRGAQDIVTAYVQLGGIGRNVLSELTALTVEFAAATGKDSKAALEELGRAFQDPAKGADDLATRYGVLTQAQIEHIKDLVEQNDLYGAQRALLVALQPAFDGAADHASGLSRAWRAISVAASDAWNWMGKAIDRAVSGGTTLQKIADLQKQRATGPTLGQMLTGTTTASYQADIDKQIAGLQANLQHQQDLQKNAAARSRGVAGIAIVDGIVGESDVGNLRTRLNTVRDLLADNGKAAGLTADQVGRAREAYNMLTHAVGTYLPEAEKQVRIAQLDAQIATAKKAHDTSKVASLAAQRTEIENSGKLMTAAQSEAIAVANGAKAKVDAAKSGDHHADQLAREAQAVEAQIRNLYKLSDAYGVSGARALVAEARVKAESAAIKGRGDVEEAVARQVRLAIAQRISEAAKSTAALQDEAAIQAQVNAEVAAGNVPAARANDLIRARMADLPLLTALQAAQQIGDKKGIEDATAALDAQRIARDKITDQANEKGLATAMAAAKNDLAQQQEELRLVGATDQARVRALATLRATQEATANHWGGTKAAEYVQLMGDIAEVQLQVQLNANAFSDSLRYQSDLLDILTANVDRAGQGMAAAFGTAGQALGDLASSFSHYIADQARLNAARTAELKIASQLTDAEARLKRERQINTLYAARSAQSQIGLFGDMAAAGKMFFAEGSKGYKTLADAEKIFRAIQFALSVKAMAQDAIETGVSLAKSAARTAAHAVEAVVKAISSLPFPANIAAGAATIAALAAIGVSVVGSLTGGSKNDLEKPNDGTGTVLGDPAAKSESIKNAIDALKNVDLLTNSYSRQMAASLKSIDSQIGGVASLVVRSGNVDANDSVAQGFKTSGLGSVLSKIPLIGGLLSGLFGTRTDVTGSGLYGGAQSLQSILGGGFNAQTYSDVTKTKKFFGIVTGRSYSTNYGAADPALGDQFTLILRSFNDAIKAAAGPLGESTDAIQSRLNSFVISIGKIDLQGLTGTQIEEKLSAVFGAAADQMANTAFPGIQQFAKVGEGAFETLVRVASTVEAVTTALDQMAGAAPALSVAAKLGIADQFDSIGDFTSAVGSYFEAFFSQEEQAAAKTAQFAKVFASLGVSMPNSLAAFRALVEAQDLNTAAGQATYATLLQLAPAFAELQASLAGAKSAADIASERGDLQRQLLQLQGDTAALRALDLAKIDPSNRALQEQVWALADAQEAAKTAQALADAWKTVGESILAEMNRIRGITDMATGGGYAQLLGQFNVANAAARGGDQDAAKSLPGLSQALLTAAANAATSKQELDRIRAQTAAALEATYGAITALTKTPIASTDATSAAMAAAVAAQAATSPAAATDDMASELSALREEVAGMRRDNNSGHAATASNTGAIKRKFEDVTTQGGGQAISVVAAAA